MEKHLKLRSENFTNGKNLSNGQKLCKNCNKIFIQKQYNNLFCSKECRNILYKKELHKTKFENSIKKYKDNPELKEEKDYIICRECGFCSQEIVSHIIKIHGMSIKEYKEKHNIKRIKCQLLCDRVKGDKNPAYRHGGKFSPFSKKFIKGDISEKTKKKVRLSKIKNKSHPTKLDYWLKKTNGDEKEAKRLLSQRQVTFSLEICIKKHGEIKGREIWKERQEKWLKSFKKSNFSQISQGLFWDIYKLYKNENDYSIYFAELDKNKQIDKSGKNYEYTLKTQPSVIKPDFFIPDINKIIEFDGDYWHDQNLPGNIKRNKKRDNTLKESGYDVLHIKEKDYKQNKQETLEKCLKFLTI